MDPCLEEPDLLSQIPVFLGKQTCTVFDRDCYF